MDITYCNDICLKGQEARDKFLLRYNSAFDVAYEFQCFTENCFKTCPYKAEHNKATQRRKLSESL